MWFLPLLVIGALVAVAASRSPREAHAAPPQLPPGPGPGPGPGAGRGPGPIAVLGEFVRIRQTPPPTVIMCAIAEAETRGRNDIASDIIRLFVAPVVHQHQMHAPRASGPQAHERGTCAPVSSHSPREGAHSAQPMSASPETSALPATRPATDEEIRAMLNADPRKFFEMATRGAPVIEVPVDAAHLAPHQVAPMVEVPSPAPQAPQVIQQPAPEPGSPIASVADGSWREFVMRLERESPQFNSTRHVGQYRQRRERLSELGVDPSVIHGSAEAQRAALDIDLVDAHRHAAEGGLLEHLGRPIAVPGQDTTAPLSLSGMLGVIQCAGLEGAVGWLENAGDRKRYPHTTQAFLRTNGVF